MPALFFYFFILMYLQFVTAQHYAQSHWVTLRVYQIRVTSFWPVSSCAMSQPSFLLQPETERWIIEESGEILLPLVKDKQVRAETFKGMKTKFWWCLVNRWIQTSESKLRERHGFKVVITQKKKEGQVWLKTKVGSKLWCSSNKSNHTSQWRANRAQQQRMDLFDSRDEQSR